MPLIRDGTPIYRDTIGLTREKHLEKRGLREAEMGGLSPTGRLPSFHGIQESLKSFPYSLGN